MLKKYSPSRGTERGRESKISDQSFFFKATNAATVVRTATMLDPTTEEQPSRAAGSVTSEDSHDRTSRNQLH